MSVTVTNLVKAKLKSLNLKSSVKSKNGWVHIILYLTDNQILIDNNLISESIKDIDNLDINRLVIIINYTDKIEKLLSNYWLDMNKEKFKTITKLQVWKLLREINLKSKKIFIFENLELLKKLNLI